MATVKTLEDGRKIISESSVKAYAFCHSDGDAVASWLAAEKWFKSKEYEIVSDEEYDSYGICIVTSSGNRSKK
ncbi:MAG: hypothetical protein ABIG73_01895 [Patescibacteria group bacterium]